MAPTRAHQSPHEFLRDAMGGLSGRFERVGAFARYVTAHAPQWMARVQRGIERLDALPVQVGRARRLGYGTRSSCILLEGTPPRVMKFVRCSLGQDVESLMEICRYEREAYTTLQRWYADVPHLFPHTVHLMLHAPVRGLRAAGEIQDLVVGHHRDLLDDHTDEELLSLLERHDDLGVNFHRFVVATRRAWDEEGRFLDMVGYNNVLLLRTPRGPELRVPDFGIWDLAHQKRTRPDLYDRASETLERLERLDDRAARHRPREESSLDSSRNGSSARIHVIRS